MNSDKNYFLIDTNIWLKTRLLRVGLGPSLIFAIIRLNSKLLLPEIVVEELKHNALRKGQEALNKIHDNFRMIEQIIGERDDYKVPNDSEFEEAVTKRISELNELIMPIDIKNEHYKLALRKLIDREVPNRKRDQYKDTLIWQALLDLDNQSVVKFVTNDKVFFEEENYNKGLDFNLKAEADSKHLTIQVYPDLHSLLLEIRDSVPEVDQEEIGLVIHNEILDKLVDLSLQQNFILGDQIQSTIEPFLTEKTNCNKC